MISGNAAWISGMNIWRRLSDVWSGDGMPERWDEMGWNGADNMTGNDVN